MGSRVIHGLVLLCTLVIMLALAPVLYAVDPQALGVARAQASVAQGVQLCLTTPETPEQAQALAEEKALRGIAEWQCMQVQMAAAQERQMLSQQRGAMMFQLGQQLLWQSQPQPFRRW